MTDVRRILERQVEWQRTLRDLPWPAKVRIAEKLRSAVIALRRSKRGAGAGSKEHDAPVVCCEAFSRRIDFAPQLVR
jgi:hypothetical protein